MRLQRVTLVLRVDDGLNENDVLDVVTLALSGTLDWESMLVPVAASHGHDYPAVMRFKVPVEKTP